MTTKRILLLFMLFVVMGIAVLAVWQQEPTPAARLEAEREVYARLLLEQKSPDIKTYPIVEYTNSGELQGNIPIDSAGLHSSFDKDEMPVLKQRTWADFEKNNQQPYPLKDYLPDTTDILFIDPAKGQQMDWWLSFSRIGFDASLTQALVLVGDCRGEACYDSTGKFMYSRGYFVLLQKTDNTWTIQDQQDAWLIEAPSP